ncbi:MAG TPA: D-tyrosyl-tRNA(Tyr) deacylase [Candidatus Dependentiae bacterium]|nr:D-tyrosyl-tRNA(Tyr) deacylase [Candidatus Dependentiae bacterium]
MRAVIQRVTTASVIIDQKEVAEISQGLLVLVGFKAGDIEQDYMSIAQKIIKLRIFNDEQGRMNKSVRDIDGELLLVSQFTLYGNCRKGNRPSFAQVMAPQQAKTLYEQFVSYTREQYVKTYSGVFQAYMQVSLVNDGPVTILLDTEKKSQFSDMSI